MSCVFVNIGSNLGDRRLNLSRGVRGIAEEFGNFEISHVVESDPWGFDSTRRFLNVGVMFESDLDPMEILSILQSLEKKIGTHAHRAPGGGYADREIDIDIIAIDERVIDLAALTVPHPHMQSRIFVLEPMAELAPGWRHPRNGMTPMEMIHNLHIKS